MFLFIFVCGITKNLTLTLKVLIYVETIIKEVMYLWASMYPTTFVQLI